jgi:hypothetical protein
MDYGFDENDPGDANEDADGDKVNNLGEYVSGSNPTNSASVLRVLSVAPLDGTNRVIRFLAFSNATYSVERRNAFSTNSAWQRLVNIPAAPTNRWVEAADTNAWEKDDRYYRVIAPALQ